MIPTLQTVDDLEKLVQRLYQPGSPQEVTRIQDQLQKWQRSEAGWEMADRLLQSQDPNVRFFGALTLTVKLNLDYDKLDTENGPTSQAVLSGLITTIIQSVNRQEAHFVLKKLSSSLVTYFCRTDTWALPVKQLVCSFHEQQFVHEDMARSVSLTPQILSNLNPLQLLTVLWFSSDLIYEIWGMLQPEHAKYHERVPINVPDIQSLLDFTLQYGKPELQSSVSLDQSSSSGLSEADTTLRQAALSCFSSLAKYLCGQSNLQEQLAAVVRLIPNALMNVYVGVDDAESIFIELLQDCRSLFNPRSTLDPKALLYELILSDWSKSRIAGIAESDPASIGFAKFVLAFAEMEVDTLRENTTSPTSKGLLELLHLFSRLSAEEDEADELRVPVLEFWSSFVESIVDGLVDGGSDVPPWREAAQLEASQAIQELLAKIVFPPPEIISAWDSDEKRAFQSFRQDFGDMLESAYMFLGDNLTKTLAEATRHHLMTQDWWHLEASIYCLNKLADTICENLEDSQTPEEVLLYTLFQSPLFTELSSNPGVPRRLLKTSVDMLACYSPLFRKRVTLLPSALTFLFSSLQIPHLSNDSARSISALCSSCRQSLTSELPAFLQQYDAFRVTPTADVYTKEKVTGGISAIIQAVPDKKEQAAFLSTLLSFVEQDVQEMVGLVANQEFEQGLAKAHAAMECLASIGEGLQSPDDAFLENDSSPQEISTSLWLPIQQRILRCLEMTIQILAEDSDIIEQACNVLRAGYKEKLMGAFVLPASATVEFVARANISTPRLPFILATAQIFLKHHIEAHNPGFVEPSRKLLHHTISLIRDLDDPSRDPEVAQSLIELLGAFTQNHMAVLRAELGPDLEHAFRFTLASIRGHDILPKRAAANFWGNLLSVAVSGKPNDQVLAKEILQYFVTDLCDALVFQITGDAPQSALEYLTVPLTKMIMAQRNVKQMIEQSLSKRYNNDTIGGARTRFVQAIMTARGVTARKVTTDFWQACRRHASTASFPGPGVPSGYAGSAADPQVIE